MMDDKPKESDTEKNIKTLINKFIRESSDERKAQYNRILANVMEQITSTEYKGIDKVMGMIAPEIIIAKLTGSHKLVGEQRIRLGKWQRNELKKGSSWRKVGGIGELEEKIDNAIIKVTGSHEFPKAPRPGIGAGRN